MASVLDSMQIHDWSSMAMQMNQEIHRLRFENVALRTENIALKSQVEQEKQQLNAERTFYQKHRALTDDRLDACQKQIDFANQEMLKMRATTREMRNSDTPSSGMASIQPPRLSGMASSQPPRLSFDQQSIQSSNTQSPITPISPSTPINQRTPVTGAFIPHAGVLPVSVLPLPIAVHQKQLDKPPGIGIKNEKYKTRMCRDILRGVRCLYGANCAYAHHVNEIRPELGEIPRINRTSRQPSFRLPYV